jgi:hypothetical protein
MTGFLIVSTACTSLLSRAGRALQHDACHAGGHAVQHIARANIFDAAEVDDGHGCAATPGKAQPAPTSRSRLLAAPAARLLSGMTVAFAQSGLQAPGWRRNALLLAGGRYLLPRFIKSLRARFEHHMLREDWLANKPEIY